MLGQLNGLTFNRDGTQNVTLKLQGDVRALYDELSGKSVDVTIKQYRKKRSMNANAYAWVLVDKIADKMRMDKVDVYREAIRGIGGVSDTVCVKNKGLETLRKAWAEHGLGWQTDTLESRVQGCTNVVLYYGSSMYDTKQMSALIDHLVQDAKALGIETLPPAELERMTREWR